MKYADLHTHTSESDGTFAPVQLVSEALKRGLSAVAITDHDTVSAVPSALKAAEETPLEVIPGIELSAQRENREVHMLGYFLNWKSEALLDDLELVRQNRLRRVHEMVKNLKGLGVELDPQAVMDIAGTGTVGRMHIARALVKGGWVVSTAEAFRKYIGDKSPAYVLGFRFSAEQAIKVIRDAGGIAVLAHPYTLGNDEWVGEFAACGLQGLEVYYPEHSQSQVNYYLDMAKKLGLLVTGGSDFHGSAKPDVKLGAVKVPFELVESLRRAKR